MKCYTFEGSTLTEQELYENIRQKLQKDPAFKNLKYAIFNIQDDQIQLIEKAHGKYNLPNSIGVSDFIDLEHDLRQSDGRIEKQHLSPAYDLNSRIENSIRQLLERRPDIHDEAEARSEVLAQIAEEDGISDFGTLMHELFSILVKARITNGSSGCNSPEFLEALDKAKQTILSSKDYTDSTGRHHAALPTVLTSKIPGGLDIDAIMTVIQKTCEDVERSVFNGRDPRTVYKSEYQIATPEVLGNMVDKAGNPVKNVRGSIDLLIVNPDGTVEIIDFKVASRAYADWYAAKQAHTDYQLATYRQILAANGVDGSKVTLKAFPIYFPLGKVANMYAENVQDRTAPNVVTPSKNLDWNSGAYTKKIQQLIATSIVPLEYESITLNTDVKEHIEAVLGKYDLASVATKKATRDELIKSIWTSQNGTTTYYNVIDRVTGEKYSSTDKQKVIKYIDGMLTRMDSFYNDQIKALVKEIKQYQASNTGSKTEFELLNSSSNSNVDVFNVLNGCFGKYCNANWQVVEIPELLDMGIFLFQNKISGLLEVVRVSDKNIRTEISICGGSSVLGKFVTNNQAQHMSTVNPMTATIGNVQLIETMVALNEVAPLLQQGKLANINIINPQLGQRDIADLWTLKQNFKYLASKAQLTNNFDNVLHTADTWEVFQEGLHDILANPTVDNELRQAVSGLDADAYNVQERIDLITSCMRKMENRYSQLRHTNFSEKRVFETPQEKVYLALSLALLYYKETPVNYDGKLSQWGLHFEEIIRILGTPFLSQYKGTLNNGFKAIGFLQGLDMSTPTSMPSKNLAALYQFWSASFQHIRSFVLKQTTYINNITVEYYKRHGVSKTSRALLNSSAVWEDFIEKGPDGKYTKELKIVKPESLSNEADKLFLNQMLWEMQKFILPGITEEQQKWRFEDHKNEILSLTAVVEAKSNGRYYSLPLRRATNFDRMRHINDAGGLWQAMKRYWDSLQDDFDPRQLHTSAQKIITSEFGNVTEMYNQYRISERARNQILEKEPVYDFETDLNLLAIDVAFQHKRKQLFDDALLHASAMATVFHYLNETTDANFDAELQNMDDESKVILKNESPISKELKDVSRGIGVAKRINSLMLLGVRPFQFLKEITYGQFTNYSRAWALKGTGHEVSAKNVFLANKYVWGRQIAGWLKSVTDDADLASFTMIQMLNKTFGIANEDLNRISQNNSLSRTGLKQGLSKYMYIFSSSPDFFNRMTLFVAKMLEDGCFDAHSVDKDGNLVYDIKNDKRFDKLTKLGLNSDSTDSEYLKQKGLYRAMVNQFIKEGYTKEDGSQLNSFDENLYLPRAYTNKEVLSIKEISDQAYGFYDHEARSLNDHKFFGLVFKQFMAFWTSKTSLWFKAPGSTTARGKFVNMMEDGKQVYIKYTENPETGEITQEYTTETDGTLEPAVIWEGEYVEGLVYSIGYTLRDIFTGKWSDIADNKQRLGNLKLALHDILVGLILYNILRLIFSDGTGKTKDIAPIERTLLRAMQDTGPQAIFGLSLTPSFVSSFEQLKQDIPSLFSEDPDLAGFISRRFGSIKDITWNQH